MAIRFRKSFGLGRLVRLNVSANGVSMSAGPRGLGSVNIPLLGRKRPPRLNVNLPGPLYYSTPLVSAVPAKEPAAISAHVGFLARWIIRLFIIGTRT